MNNSNEVLEEQCRGAAYRAARFHEWLKPLLYGSAAAKNAYATKDRLKLAGDITSKVKAKRAERPGYGPDDVTDGSGFRVVCLFNADIPTALGQIFDLIKAPVGARPGGRFIDRPVKEVIFYSSRRRDDPLSIRAQLNDIVTAHGHELKEPEDRGNVSYSSVHLIVEGEIIEEGTQPMTGFSEIQVRSVFEEAWGEINHRLKYAPAKKLRARGAAALEPDPLDHVWLHLDALKSVTDGCAQYADLINIEIGARRPPEPPPNPSSTAPMRASLQPFEACAHHVRKLVEEAFDAEAAAEDLSLSDPTKPEAFRNAATRFEITLRAFDESDIPNDAIERDRLRRLLREEIAYGYMFSRNAELESAAEKIYEDLLSSDPENVNILTRLAQIKRKAEQLEVAYDLLTRAWTAAETHRGQWAGKIRWLLARNLAYLCWRLVDDRRDRPDALELLRTAVRVSNTAVEAALTPGQRRNAMLNLLYYYVDLFNRPELSEKEEAVGPGRRLLASARAELEGASIVVSDLDTSDADTLMRAEFAFGDRERARDLAWVVIGRLNNVLTQRSPRATVSEVLTPQEEDMMLYAQGVLWGMENP